MATQKIPEGYNIIMPYLILPNAAGFIDFMQEVFGAEVIQKVMRDKSTIMHGEIKVGDGVIMFADSTDQYNAQPGGMFIYVEDADAAYNKAIAEGATAVTPISDQSYGRTGGVKDPFGNTWWITSIR